MHSRPPMARMQRIHELLISGEPVCRYSLAQALEVSAKTIQRDLDFMRERLGAQIAYDPSSHAYAYVKPGSAFYLMTPPTEQPDTAPVPGSVAALLDEQANVHLQTICLRHGISAESVLRAILGDMLAEAVSDSTIMRSIVAAARALAVNGREAA